MDSKTVFSKTAHGLREASGASSGLPRALRRVLKEIDGKRTLADLEAVLPKLAETEIRESLQRLEKEGYVRDTGQLIQVWGSGKFDSSSAMRLNEGLGDLDFTSPTTSPAMVASRGEGLQAQQDEAAKVKQFAESKTKREAEQLKAKQETEEKARGEAEARAKREAEEQARRQAEEEARRAAEQRAQREAEAKARREVEKARREAEEHARKEAEEAARREAEARAKREAEEQARRQAEEDARRAAEEKAQRDAEVKARREAEENARREAEAQAKREAEEQARREAEETARREAAEKARREADGRARREADQRASAEAAERAEQAAKEQERLAAWESSKRKAEEKLRAEADQKARLEAEDRIRVEARERAQREAEAELKAALKERARREAEEKARLERTARDRKEAEEAVRREAKAAAKREERERSARIAAEKVAMATDRRAARPRVKWGKLTALAAPPVLALVIAVVHFISFTSRIPPLEAAAAQHFGQPVSIGDLHFTLFPQPHWRLDGVTVGRESQIEIPTADAVISLRGLLADQPTYESIRLNSPVIKAEAAKWLLFGKIKNAAVNVNYIRVKDGALVSPHIDLPRFDARADFGPDANWHKMTLEFSDGATYVELVPAGELVRFDISATNFQPPFGGALRFADFTAKGSIAREEMAIAEFEARDLGGSITGEATVGWGNGWKLSGVAQAKQLDMRRLAPTLVRGAFLDGKAAYSARAGDAKTLLASLHVEGSFTVSQGELLGVDLMYLFQGGGDSRKTGFREATGSFVHQRGVTNIKPLRVDAGIFGANGSAVVEPNAAIRGRFATSYEFDSQRKIGSVSVSGTLKAPRFAR